MRRIVSMISQSEGYDRYDAADPLLTANQISRWHVPFRATHKGWSTTMLNSAQNAGDHRVQWGEAWGVNATKSHAISDQHGRF